MDKKTKWLNDYLCGTNKADKYITFFELIKMLEEAWLAALQEKLSGGERTTNTDYATALRTSSLFRDSGIDATLEHFEQWCFERLHSEEPNVA
jgi:hypothetical protein